MSKVEAAYHFPRGFLWGSATASHQVEGRNANNNWSRWEKMEGKIVNGEVAGLAADWWGGRWKEDFDRAAETGQNAHRMSIEWSRIQPEKDRWDEDALDYYREMVRGLLERNLTPMITLHHFTDPLWLTDIGGWLNPDTPAYFEKYVRKVVEALKEYVTLWVTINEPNVYCFVGYLYGQFPPGSHSMSECWQVMLGLLKGHAAAYHAIHQIQREARVGMAINFRSFIPSVSWSPFDHIARNVQHSSFNQSFPVAAQTGKISLLTYRATVPEAKGTQDFIGVNYYSRDFVSFAPLHPETTFISNHFHKNDQLSGTGYIADVSAGMYEALKWSLQFKVPIMVTENGVEDEHDVMRPRYLLNHIHQVWRGVNFNWPIKGYFHWSLVDNFEWERGWTQRFGLWGLDLATQLRIRRPSVDCYAEICKENGITTAMVEKYAPDAMENIFRV